MRALSEHQQERRSKRRFLIEQDVHYQRLKGTKVLEAGMGKTLDMSSRALRFTTASALCRGDKVKVAVNWPVLLDATCHLQMVIYGWVVRSDGNSAAVSIGHHELRTRATGQLVFASAASSSDARAMV